MDPVAWRKGTPGSNVLGLRNTGPWFSSKSCSRDPSRSYTVEGRALNEPPPPSTASATDVEEATSAPARGGLVLGTLILVAAVANLNLSVANVALPDIGKAFDASQTALDLVAVGFSLGLAASVLYFGA